MIGICFVPVIASIAFIVTKNGTRGRGWRAGYCCGGRKPIYESKALMTCRVTCTRESDRCWKCKSLVLLSRG
jgi:hypothetical protein